MASWYEAEVNVRFLLTFALCSWPALAQSNQESETNMSCVERLQMPVYPPLADQARIAGSVTATVVVASDGSIQTEVVGHALLSPAVEKAIRASAFRKTCGGKSVTADVSTLCSIKIRLQVGRESRSAIQTSFGFP